MLKIIFNIANINAKDPTKLTIRIVNSFLS